MYFTAYNGDASKNNNSIKQLIVPATFKKVGQETGSRPKSQRRRLSSTVPRFLTVIRASVKAVKAFTRCLRC